MINKLLCKIFVIGFNKTGTTTIHHLFTSNKLKSIHDVNWDPHLETYMCFSDAGDKNNFKKLKKAENQEI